jgi:putative endonuclease
MGAFVYILRCSDGSYYTGSARGEELDRRVSEHQQGIGGDYTRRRLPVTLFWHVHFDEIRDAVLWERKIKGWSRAKKQAMMNGDWDSVSFFAKRPTEQVRLLNRKNQETSSLRREVEGFAGRGPLIFTKRSPV